MIRVLTFMLALLFVMPAFAADDGKPTQSAPPLLMLKQYPPTHPEHILMAYNKIAGLSPDFLDWAKKSPFLANTKPEDRDTIIDRENNRLMQAWSDFDPNDPIVVHTGIHLDNYSTIQEILYLSEFTPKTFFSFSVYGQSVAIVPKDILSFSKIAIDKEQMDGILREAGGGQVEAEILLKPVVADAQTPFVQDGKSYWLLLAEIGEIRFWTNTAGSEPKLLWMHRADWFKPKEDKALMDLKGSLE